MNTQIIDKSLSLIDISNDWLRFYKNSFKPGTYQTYKCLLDKYILNSFLADCPINKISSMKLVEFSELLLRKRLSAKTINDILLVVNANIKFSHDLYGIDMVSIPFLKVTKKEMRVLSRAEQVEFERYLKTDMNINKLGVLFALYTGIRIGELCALKWEDINNGFVKISKTMYRLRKEENSEVIITEPKTQSSCRTIPIPQFINSIVELYRKDNEEFVLGTKRTPIVEPRLMQIRFKKMAADCCLESVTFHTLRHTFATRCIECGFDVKSLSEILGHADVKTTLNRYVHSSMEQKQHNMNKLSEIAV